MQKFFHLLEILTFALSMGGLCMAKTDDLPIGIIFGLAGMVFLII